MDQLPKGVIMGETLSGSMSFIKKNEASTLGAADKPGGYAVKYVAGPTKAPPAANISSVTAVKSSDSNVTENVIDGLQIAVKEAKVKYLKSLTNVTTVAFADLYNQLVEEFPNETSLHVCMLHHVESKAKEYYCYNTRTDYDSETKERVLAMLLQVISSADKVLSQINTVELAASLGTLADKDDTKSVSNKKDAEAKKCILADTLYSKIMAVFHINRIGGESSLDEEKLYKQLVQWENVNACDKFWRLSVERYKKINK